MADKILIAVIFVEFQRQVGQLALQNSDHSVGKWKGGLSAVILLIYLHWKSKTLRLHTLYSSYCFERLGGDILGLFISLLKPESKAQEDSWQSFEEC